MPYYKNVAKKYNPLFLGYSRKMASTVAGKIEDHALILSKYLVLEANRWPLLL